MSAPGNKGFEGLAGVLVAPFMARMNRDMEEAALRAVPLPDGTAILVIGCGPGMGLTELLNCFRPSRVLAVDPSRAMLTAAKRRVSSATGSRTSPVAFLHAPAVHLGPRHGQFDLAVAVNCHQLWEPRAESTAAVASVLTPGGSLVSLTHTWAIEKRCPVDQWQKGVDGELIAAGFGPGAWSTAGYRSGDGLLLTATMRTDPSSRRAYD